MVLKVLEYQAPGKSVQTHRHPEGVPVQVRIVPYIADLPASWKGAGFVSIKGNLLCSFCKCLTAEIEILDLNRWATHTGAEVRQQAQTWLEQGTKSGHDALVTKNGVRWTSLHRLPDWDPVRHHILGFMHNWLEGVLAHQLRTLWGIGRDQKNSEKLDEIDAEETFTDMDVSDSADEAEELQREIEEYEALAAGIGAMPLGSDGDITPRGSPTPAPMEIDVRDYGGGEDEDPDDGPYIPGENDQVAFDADQLTQIRTGLAEITRPTWVNGPPTNLGEKVHGKLKAEEFLTIFSDFFPLIIPEFWWPGANALEKMQLKSFYDLVASTNIVASFKTSNSEAEAYTSHYKDYQQSIQHLYPDFASKPNHHFAMHNEWQLKYWGPLPSLSEFPGERMNGLLQKIKTNRHRCK